MRYEAKHSYLKQLAQNLGNFINIAWTLASRHQKWQCYHWLSDEPLGQVEPEIGPGKLATSDIHCICTLIDVPVLSCTLYIGVHVHVLALHNKCTVFVIILCILTCV